MNIHKEIIKIISFKKNIYLICLILALIYIAFNKLYKKKESFDTKDGKIIFEKKNNVFMDNIDTPVLIISKDDEDGKNIWVNMYNLKIGNEQNNFQIVPLSKINNLKEEIKQLNIDLDNCKNNVDLCKNNVDLCKNNVEKCQNKGVFSCIFN